VVRLLRGDFSAETVYGGDALAVARRFETDGTSWIHMVDLDAARTGEPANLDTIAAVVGAVACKVQVGGGVRDVDAAARLIDVGVARVVVGTAAVEHPELVDGLCARFPDRVAVGLDAKGREVAVRGWVDGSGVDVVDLATRFEQSGVAALVVTGILTDGTLEGPDLDTLEDLRSLDALDVSGRRLAGAIVGRALYEQRFTVAEAVDALRP
jgi:phosphoribosylformimino-5-aminoimidazole carboxamide ribotide isomerase